MGIVRVWARHIVYHILVSKGFPYTCFKAKVYTILNVRGPFGDVFVKVMLTATYNMKNKRIHVSSDIASHGPEIVVEAVAGVRS